ncbi:sensor histidine kinase [Nocardioides terrisoli]|uniref:sensor histidine kinase n=1 Tax=Nocardioides terrisoli TaxID=3388267 RepID=UPI00287BA172|nr:ATP-binding protein [Nocardioides marmorisolisilvae]
MRRPDAEAVFRMLASQRADPRPAQLALLLPVAIDLGFRFGGAWPDAYDVAAFLGWALVALATVGAALVGMHRLPASLSVALPVLDIVALGLLRLDTSSPVAIALVIPAVWLGLQFQARGVWIALVATALSMLVPGLITSGATLINAARAVQMLVTVGLCSSLVALVTDSWTRQRSVLEQSQRRAAEALTALTMQRRIQEAVLTTVDVGLVSIDAEGRYTSMNPRHLEFMALAYPEGHDGLAGQLGAVYDEDGVTALADSARMPSSRAARGEEFEDQLIWVGADPAERRALAVSSRSVRDGDGRFAGAVLAYHDVTDLIRALRARQDFVASVSHELRTPLTSIVGYLDVVRDDIEGVPDQARGYLDTAARNAERLIRLVSDLLQVGQHDAGVSLELAPVELADAVRECVDTCRVRAAEAGVVLELDAPPSLRMPGDGHRLRQVVDNLVANALKYSRAGDEIRVSLDASEGEVRLSVRDTGIGIAPDELEHLFTRFYRAREAHRLAIQGAGLGLSICKEIVEAHGGSITVASELGVGTEFVVRLPLDAGVRAAS